VNPTVGPPTPVEAFPEPAAATLGTLPSDGVTLERESAGVGNGDCPPPMDETDMLRAGLAG
jgi:hypothetical protein